MTAQDPSQDPSMFDPEPFAQIPGQTCFDWNQAPDTRDVRQRAECHDCGRPIHTLGFRCDDCQRRQAPWADVRPIVSSPTCLAYPTENGPARIMGRWDPFQ